MVGVDRAGRTPAGQGLHAGLRGPPLHHDRALGRQLQVELVTVYKNIWLIKKYLTYILSPVTQRRGAWRVLLHTLVSTQEYPRHVAHYTRGTRGT